PLRGLRSLVPVTPRFADSAGPTFCRPLRGLRSLAPVAPGSRTHRGLHSVARCAGSDLWCPSPPASRTHRGIVFCRRCAGSCLGTNPFGVGTQHSALLFSQGEEDILERGVHETRTHSQLGGWALRHQSTPAHNAYAVAYALDKTHNV